VPVAGLEVCVGCFRIPERKAIMVRRQRRPNGNSYYDGHETITKFLPVRA
jgi:hypothetical protein